MISQSTRFEDASVREATSIVKRHTIPVAQNNKIITPMSKRTDVKEDTRTTPRIHPIA